GIIYNNTFKGYYYNGILIGEGRLSGQSAAPMNFCDSAEGGPQAWDNNLGDPAAPGWPCYTQTGRQVGPTPAQIAAGMKQTSFPFYWWNNGGQPKCSNPAAAGPPCDNSAGPGGAAPYFLGTPHITAGGPGTPGYGDIDYSVTASQPTGAGTHTLVYTPFT